jgi:GNAT superfamily N-acetyltransferase
MITVPAYDRFKIRRIFSVNNIKKGIYRHYKGNLYEVIDLAKDSEKLQDLVVYRALHDSGQLWVRPLQMFFENVEVNGKILKRFEFVGEENEKPITIIGEIHPDYKICEASPSQAEVLNIGLDKFNIKQLSFTGNPSYYEKNYLIKDKKEKVIAGIRGRFYYKECLYVSILYVEESKRKQGLGSILLNLMQQEAIAKGVKLIHLDTFDFQAKDFYLMHGYEIFAVLDGSPQVGHKRYYMKKLL